MATLEEVVRASELLRQASGFGEAVYGAVFEALRAKDADLVPEELPAMTDRDIAIATDKVVRARFPTPPAPMPEVAERRRPGVGSPA